MFNEKELLVILDLCIDAEEEFGGTRSDEERITCYQIAEKINAVVGNKAKSLSLMEWNMNDLLK